MKQENIISNIVIGICTILLVVVILSNVYSFFPNLTISLGTLSDWFMVLITAVTAVFLYRTLQSQMEVQRDQEKINKLSMFDIRSKYLPKIINNNDKTSTLGFDIDTLWQMDFIIEEHHAISIIIKSNLPFTTSHECEYFTKDNFYFAEFEMLSKGSIFNLWINNKTHEEYLKNSRLDESKMHSYLPYAFIEFKYKDNFGFDYYCSYTYEFQPITNLVRIRESSIDFL